MSEAPAEVPLYAAAYLTPWGLLSLLLPPHLRWAALGLLAVLALLLVAAGAWAARRAEARGLDGAGWAFAAVVSLGYSNVLLLAAPPAPGAFAPSYVCHECARVGRLHEPFCFGCGAA